MYVNQNNLQISALGGLSPDKPTIGPLEVIDEETGLPAGEFQPITCLEAVECETHGNAKRRFEADEATLKELSEWKNTADTDIGNIKEQVGIGETPNFAPSVPNATATRADGVVAITAPEGAQALLFYAPGDFDEGDTYTLNGTPLTLTDLAGNPLTAAWQSGAPVQLMLKGARAFFKAGGGGGTLDPLPPLLPGLKLERYTDGDTPMIRARAEKLLTGADTAMLAGGRWAIGSTMPEKPSDGTQGKDWSAGELLWPGKPFTGEYLGDVQPSNEVSEAIFWGAEKDENGKRKLVPFKILGERYGGVALVRKGAWINSKFNNSINNLEYEGSPIDELLVNSYLTTVLDDSIKNHLMTVDVPIYAPPTSSLRTIQRRAFIPSGTEYGHSDSALVALGEPFIHFAVKANRIAYNDAGTPVATWTRSPVTNSDSAINISGSGEFASTLLTTVLAIRPMIVLPKNTKLQRRPDGSYTLWDDSNVRTLADIAVSDRDVETKVYIKETGGSKPFIYASGNYNESGGGLMVRQELDNHGSTANDYITGPAHARSVEWSENVLSPEVYVLLMAVPIKYATSPTNIAESIAKAFILSGDELGNQPLAIGQTGTPLPYFYSASRRIALKNGQAPIYWTRDATSGNSAICVNASGNFDVSTNGVLQYIRPCIVLPLDTPVYTLPDGSYEVICEQAAPAQVMALAATETAEGEPYVEYSFAWPADEACFIRQFTYAGDKRKSWQTMLQGAVVSTENPSTGPTLREMQAAYNILAGTQEVTA